MSGTLWADDAGKGIEGAVQWLSVAVDEDGLMWVRDEIDGFVDGPTESVGMPTDAWIASLLAAMERVVRNTYQ